MALSAEQQAQVDAVTLLKIIERQIKRQQKLSELN
jgi:hypothetical protein